MTAAKRSGRRWALPTLIIGATLAAATTRAAQALQVQPHARINLVRANEDGNEVLVATVTRAGQPVPGVLVGFHVERALGWLLLGEDQTLEYGTAAVDYPADLPAGPGGALRVSVAVLEPDDLAGLTTDTVLTGVATARIAEREEPRALWAVRAPIPLLVTIAALLVAVWSTYAFVIAQLWGIRRYSREE